jgi:hypothetical protein
MLAKARHARSFKAVRDRTFVKLTYSRSSQLTAKEKAWPRFLGGANAIAIWLVPTGTRVGPADVTYITAGHLGVKKGELS